MSRTIARSRIAARFEDIINGRVHTNALGLGPVDTRVPSGTQVTIQRGKKSIPVVIDYSRVMNRR